MNIVFAMAAQSNIAVHASKGSLQAIDVPSGQVLWRKEIHYHGGAPCIVFGLVCVPVKQGLAFFELASGADAGLLELPDSVRIGRSLIEIDGRVFFHDKTGRVWLAGRDGSKFQILWSDVPTQ